MNLSFSSKIRLMVVMFFIIALLQGVIIFSLISQSGIDENLKMNIHNTIYISLFIFFFLLLLLFFYQPVFLRKALKSIHLIIDELSQGNYSVDFNLEEYESNLDKEFYEILVSIKKMQTIILRFDTLKKEKVIEQKNRIDALLNLTDDGFLILDITGEIVYINDIVKDTFPPLAEKINLSVSNFQPEIENNIKKYLMTIQRTKSRQEPYQFFVPHLKKHVTIKSALVKKSTGVANGVVLKFSNLERKKQEKSKEIEE